MIASSQQEDDILNYRLLDAILESGIPLSKIASRSKTKKSRIADLIHLRTFPDDRIAKKLSRALGKKIADIFPEAALRATEDLAFDRIIPRPDENTPYRVELFYSPSGPVAFSNNDLVHSGEKAYKKF